MTPTLIPDTVAILTSADRCDRCGARAATRVILAGGYDLLSAATSRAATSRHDRLWPAP
jgi:hypothetical protein